MAPDTVTPVLFTTQRLTRHVAHDDSMAPVINLGDSFYFDPFERPSGDELVDGAVYALSFAGEALVRRVFVTSGRVRLQPDNSDCAAIDLTPAEGEKRGLWIAGRVVHREGRVI